MGPKYVDITCQKYGKLTAVEHVGKPQGAAKNRRYWRCVCDCSKEVLVDSNSLRTGNTISCGCSRKDMGVRARRYPGATKQEREVAKRLRSLFNITPEERQRVLDFQGGVCAISKRPSGKLCVDHDHKTGLVRGVLDWKVNRALEAFRDNPEWLRAAADYLENPPATAALGEEVYGVMGKVTRKAANRRYGPRGSRELAPRKNAVI